MPPRAGSRPPPVDRGVAGPGQESVWDYPRPPRVEPVRERIRVVVGGLTVADSTRALRVLETAGPPVYYLPPVDVRTDLLRPSPHLTSCEWKGRAAYHTLELSGRSIRNVAWSYPEPQPGRGDSRSSGPSTRSSSTRPGSATSGPRRSRVVTTVAGSPREFVGPFKGELGSEGW